MIKHIVLSLLILSILLSSPTTIAAEEYSAFDICEALGIIQGEGSGITFSYMIKNTTRLQGAIMFLRMKGLEEEALSYVSNDNFTDAEDVSWGGGRAILAYLRNHPELGWIGDTAGNFNPNNIMTVQAYYKVLLELLGYNYNEDFTWDEVITFSASKGMTLGKSYTSLSNSLFARLTVEGLKAKTRTGNLLIEDLVDSAVINDEKAAALNLIPYPINKYYDLDFVAIDYNDTITIEGYNITQVTIIVRKIANNTRIDVNGSLLLNLTEGQLGSDTAKITNGQATVIIVTKASSQPSASVLTAEVIEGYKEVSFTGLKNEYIVEFDFD